MKAATESLNTAFQAAGTNPDGSPLIEGLEPLALTVGESGTSEGTDFSVELRGFGEFTLLRELHARLDETLIVEILRGSVIPAILLSRVAGFHLSAEPLKAVGIGDERHVSTLLL